MSGVLGQRSVRSDHGQALPEFALIVPVLLLLLFGIIQFGILLSGQIGFTNGVREAARYASTVPTATAAQVETELQTRALPKAIPGFIASNFDAGATVVSYCSYTNPDHTIASPSYSIKVRVSATYRHWVFMPFLDGIDGTADGALAASVTEEMRVENPRLTSPGGIPACP
jgi:Flp pilus assembly protein TadG